MAVKIIIIRQVPQEKEQELRPLLLKMRSLAHAQNGYISGETLVNFDNPNERIVISAWKSIDNWNEWLNNEERQAMQADVDRILGTETMYQIYYNG